MKKLKIISLITALILVFATLVSCNVIASGNGSGTGDNGNGGSDTFNKKVTLSDKITLHVVDGDSGGGSALADVLDTIRSSVVEIYGATDGGTSAGSGVIVDIADADENGKNDTAYIITCHHVIEGTSDARVTAYDGKNFSATLVGSDPKSDIGLIAVKGNDGDFDGYSVANWYGDSDNLRYGMDVVAIGNPLGILGGTVTKGIISGIGRAVTVEGKTMTLLQTDAAINGGNSGGGLFDANTGALVGIVNAGYPAYTADGLNFAIPSNVAKEKESMLFSTYSSGETFGYIEGDYDFGAEFGVYSSGSPWSGYRYYIAIQNLDAYGIFAKNGFKENDIIKSVKIGDKTIYLTDVSNSTLDALTEFLNGDHKIGDDVTVVYERRGSANTVSFKITQYIYGD